MKLDLQKNPSSYCTVVSTAVQIRNNRVIYAYPIFDYDV